MSTTPTPPEPIPFNGRVMPGQVGSKVLAVTRSLARAGYGKLENASRWMGPKHVQHLRNFQKAQAIKATGLYGRKSHKALTPFFDDYSRLLYSAPPRLQGDFTLPATFTPTHETAGLPGYPAVDVFAKAGSAAGAPEQGVIRRISGKDPANGGVPGGAYGWNVYLTSPSGEYFLAHFEVVLWPVGAQLKRGDAIGRVCDAAVAGMPSSSSHIHCGKKPAV